MNSLNDYIVERIRVDNLKRNTTGFDFNNGPIDLGNIEGTVRLGNWGVRLNADDWQAAVIGHNSNHDMDLLVFWSEKCNLVAYATKWGIEHGHKLHVIKTKKGSVDYNFYPNVLKYGVYHIEQCIPYETKLLISTAQFPEIFRTVIDSWKETWK